MAQYKQNAKTGFNDYPISGQMRMWDAVDSGLDLN